PLRSRRASRQRGLQGEPSFPRGGSSSGDPGSASLGRAPRLGMSEALCVLSQRGYAASERASSCASVSRFPIRNDPSTPWRIKQPPPLYDWPLAEPVSL